MFVYAVTNHKGGVGKTTATATLGAAFARAGRRVLLVDLDPQSSLTVAVGAHAADITVEDVLEAPWILANAIVPCASGMHIVPARVSLAVRLHKIMATGTCPDRIDIALRTVKQKFDSVLIDCPASIGAAMANGLAAANVALVPIQCDYLSLRGLADIQEACGTLSAASGTFLEVRAFASMYDSRASHAWDVLTEARSALGARMLETLIPRSVRMAEAPATGTTALEFAPRSRAVEAYCRLAQELISWEKSHGKTGRHPSGNTSAALGGRFAAARRRFGVGGR